MPLREVGEVVDALGGTAALARHLGITPPAVSNWRALGWIPAEHFLLVSELADDCGLKLDPHVFGFNRGRS